MPLDHSRFDRGKNIGKQIRLTSIRPPERAAEIELIDEKGEERDCFSALLYPQENFPFVSVH